jgi:hypothetical protein
MNYVALREADRLAGVADPAQAAIAVRSIKQTLPPQLIRKADAREPLIMPGLLTMWERIAAQSVSSLTAPTPGDMFILLVQTFHRTLTLTDISTLDLRSDAAWQAFLAKAAIVTAEGLLPQDIIDFWGSLRTPEVLILDPADGEPTADDMLAARALYP